MSVPKPRVKLHPSGVVDLLQDPGVRDDLLRRGEAVAARMDATAPVDTGALSRSHRVYAEDHGDRVVVRVGSDLDYAAKVAVATGYMARALDGAQ